MDPELKKLYLELLDLIKALRLPEWPLEEITREKAWARVANALGFDINDPSLLDKAQDKVNKILAGELEMESVPKNLDELVEMHEEYKQELERQREAQLKRTYPTLSEQARKALQKKYAQDLQKQLVGSEQPLPEEEKVLTQNPERAEKVSQQIADELASRLPQTAREKGPAALSEKDYQENLNQAQPRIEQILKQAGVPEPKKHAQAFIEQAVRNLPVAQEVAATPRSYEKEVPPPPPRREFKSEELVLPQEVAAKLATESEGVAFLPVYTALQPQVAGTYVRKLTNVVPAKMLGLTVPEATPEWQEMIGKGIFVEDIEATIVKLKEAGLPENHPIRISLENKKSRFLERQKIKVIRKDNTFFYKDKPAVRILKNYYSFSKRTGRYSVFDRETGVHFQSSPAPDWSRKRGYSWQVRRGLNRVGLATRLFENIEIGPGKTAIRFVFSEARGRIYQKTVGRAVSFTVKKLAKTTIGKAVKKVAIKAGTWLATKLGVEIGVVAAGTALAPGVGTAVGIAISVGIEIAQKTIGKVWDKVKTIFREPEKALAFLLGGLAVATIFSFSLPLVIFGAGVAAIGGLALLGWGIASGGAIISAFGASTIAFFTALTVAPITAAIAWLVIAVVGVITGLTFFIVMTTAGAFILPVGPIITEKAYPPPEEAPIIPPPPGLTFQWPIKASPFCSDPFGYRKKPISAVPCCQYHTGIDIVEPSLENSCGVEVYPAAEGTVYYVGSGGGFGNKVVIRHNGLFSIYAHLEEWYVSQGQTVDLDTVIGAIGSSGNSTGCHLHFGFSNCGGLNCFMEGDRTPNPCDYVSCSSNCQPLGREAACGGLSLCQ